LPASHAPRNLEEQPAGERDANRPVDEESFGVGHHHYSAAKARPINPAEARVKTLRLRILE
jgi:hypothetical protein